MNSRKIVVIFPGVGYTKDRPLLYYSRKLASLYGYEEICVNYQNLPDNIRGNKEKMTLAAKLAYEQTVEALKSTDFSEYDRVLFIGKSIGTFIAAKYAEEYVEKVSLILYTPVEATFRPKLSDAIAFIGDSDPWSCLDDVKKLAETKGVSLNIYNKCNHSLEAGDVSYDLSVLTEVMKITEVFIAEKEKN